MELVSIAVLAAMLSGPAAARPVTADVAPARLTITSLPQFTQRPAPRGPLVRERPSGAKRAAMIAGGAVAGFFAGGYIGSKLEPNCRCDDPGLKGFLHRFNHRVPSIDHSITNCVCPQRHNDGPRVGRSR